ncbi:hypothetical protein FS837_006005 [Tulasnella sp. UAMH 9824]|nr:hypothetical protein FS837_006005 [Tulasnella sp. UAMH 9824]
MPGGPDPESSNSRATGALVYPDRACYVRDLPYDILYLIFNFSWDRASHRQQDFPVVISHVCRLWRQYALDTPGFWTSLKFENAIPAIEEYRTWLERSKDSPFEVEIGCQPFVGESIKHAKAIMRLISSHVQRLRFLRVTKVPFKIRQLIFDRLNNVHLPSLETLHVQRGWSTGEKPSISDRKFKPFCHGDASKLRHADLEWVPYNYVVYRFKNLESLSIFNVASNSSRDNAKTVQEILSQLPNLRILRLGLEREHYSERQSVIPVLPPLTHCALEEMYLNVSQNDVDTIICNLTLPSLRQFRQQHGLGMDLFISIHCLPTIAQAHPRHPYPNLISLRLAGEPSYRTPEPPVARRYMESLEQVLAGLPQLESLILLYADLEDSKHLMSLTRTCPRLKRLSISSCFRVVLKELRAVIRQRRDPEGMGSNSLESVIVTDDKWTIQRLHKEAKEHGLGGDPDFNIEISTTVGYRIVVVGNPKLTNNLDNGPEALSHPHPTCHVLSLPYDIMYLIFSFSLDQTHHRKHDFPTVMSHVCQLWRQYALDAPSFWTSLRFESATPEIEMYRAWLERSKDSPFDLVIGWLPFIGASLKNAKTIMRLIFPHAHRLRSLQVSNVPFKIRQVIFDRLNNTQMPLLETLNIERGWHVDEKPSLADRKFKPFIHGNAANLKHVILKNVPYDYVIHRFKNLQTLSIVNRKIFAGSRSDNVKAVQDILSLLPHLHTLRIDQERVAELGSGIPQLPPLTHNTLEYIYLNASQGDSNAIFCNLVLPSLRQIRRQSELDFPIGICCLPRMAQAPPGHSYPSLISLTLNGRDGFGKPHPEFKGRNMEFLERALARVPWLESLTLTHVDLEDNKHLICLARTYPRLKRLALIFCSRFELRELRATVRSRRGPKGMGSDSLEYVHIVDDAPRIQRLHEEAEEQGLGEDPDFNIAISKTNRAQIVVVDRV